MPRITNLGSGPVHNLRAAVFGAGPQKDVSLVVECLAHGAAVGRAPDEARLESVRSRHAPGATQAARRRQRVGRARALRQRRGSVPDEDSGWSFEREARHDGTGGRLVREVDKLGGARGDGDLVTFAAVEGTGGGVADLGGGGGAG